MMLIKDYLNERNNNITDRSIDQRSRCFLKWHGIKDSEVVLEKVSIKILIYCSTYSVCSRIPLTFLLLLGTEDPVPKNKIRGYLTTFWSGKRKEIEREVNFMFSVEWGIIKIHLFGFFILKIKMIIKSCLRELMILKKQTKKTIKTKSKHTNKKKKKKLKLLI